MTCKCYMSESLSEEYLSLGVTLNCLVIVSGSGSQVLPACVLQAQCLHGQHHPKWMPFPHSHDYSTGRWPLRRCHQVWQGDRCLGRREQDVWRLWKRQDSEHIKGPWRVREGRCARWAWSRALWAIPSIGTSVSVHREAWESFKQDLCFQKQPPTCAP